MVMKSILIIAAGPLRGLMCNGKVQSQFGQYEHDSETAAELPLCFNICWYTLAKLEL